MHSEAHITYRDLIASGRSHELNKNNKMDDEENDEEEDIEMKSTNNTMNTK